MACVYFVTDGRGSVKIGSTCRGPGDRIRSLQTGSPYELILLWSVSFKRYDDARRREFGYHSRFSKYRIRRNGEWFYLNGELSDFIENKISQNKAKDFIGVLPDGSIVFESKESRDFGKRYMERMGW